MLIFVEFSLLTVQVLLCGCNGVSNGRLAYMCSSVNHNGEEESQLDELKQFLLVHIPNPVPVSLEFHLP